jgi:hypothetical protein
MTINFGALPARASFTMSSDADFYQEVDTDDGTSYPGSAVMTLQLLDAADAEVDSWTATFSGGTATFQEDKTTVATALASTPVQGRLFYEDGAGGPELLLAQGPIRDISP